MINRQTNDAVQGNIVQLVIDMEVSRYITFPIVMLRLDMLKRTLQISMTMSLQTYFLIIHTS